MATGDPDCDDVIADLIPVRPGGTDNTRAQEKRSVPDHARRRSE
jgi:hypothetical protein